MSEGKCGFDRRFSIIKHFHGELHFYREKKVRTKSHQDPPYCDNLHAILLNYSGLWCRHTVSFENIWIKARTHTHIHIQQEIYSKMERRRKLQKRFRFNFVGIKALYCFNERKIYILEPLGFNTVCAQIKSLLEYPCVYCTHVFVLVRWQMDGNVHCWEPHMGWEPQRMAEYQVK